MATLTRGQVIDNINKIAEMNKSELERFSIKISLSNIDDKAKNFLFKAIDLKKEELRNRVNPEVENGEIDDLID